MNEDIEPKEIYDLQTKKYEIEKSYISKEEFINIINNIEFIGINKCDMELVTGCIIDTENKEIKPVYKSIEIS